VVTIQDADGFLRGEEGAMLQTEGEERFWLAATETALAEVWDNPQDDVYVQLLQE
jgi:hypothetical protein